MASGIKGQIAIDLTDQLGVIVLTATDDCALDLRPVAFAEIVRAENDVRTHVGEPFKPRYERVMHAVAHEEDVHFVPTPNGSLCQLNDGVRILMLRACT